MKKHILEHIIFVTIAILLSIGSLWLLHNWTNPFVVDKTKRLSELIEGYGYIIEPVLTIIMIAISKIISRIITHYNKGTMAIGADMFFWSENSDVEQKKESNNFLQEEGNKCVHIYILGASGWKTFGSSNSPLHEALHVCAKAHIILLHPLSGALPNRADAIKQSPQAYRKEIYDSIDYLKNIREEREDDKSIELKMYNRYPVNKFIFLGRYVWIQRYPKNKNVNESPCCAFFRSYGDGDLLYSCIFDNFHKYWNDYSLGIYNFDTTMLEYFDKSGRKTSEMPTR